MWRVSSNDGKSWVRYEAGLFSAAGDGVQAIIDADRPVEVAPMTGDVYTPTGQHDPVAVFLHARRVIGWPLQVTGTPPAGVPVPASPPTGEGAPVG